MKKTNYFSGLVVIAILTFTTLVNHCNGQASSIQTIKIGKATWMSENLNVDKFRNGDPIPVVTNEIAWKFANKKQKPVCCYYNYDPVNGKKFGKLYNWYAVNDPRGLAPEGWHVPSDAEWSACVNNFDPGANGGQNQNEAGKKLKSNNGWNKNGNGTNESGFNAMPGGACIEGGFQEIGEYGTWWSSTEVDNETAWSWKMDMYSNNIERTNLDKWFGYSVRCIKN